MKWKSIGGGNVLSMKLIKWVGWIWEGVGKELVVRLRREGLLLNVGKSEASGVFFETGFKLSRIQLWRKRAGWGLERISGRAKS